MPRLSCSMHLNQEAVYQSIWDRLHCTIYQQLPIFHCISPYILVLHTSRKKEISSRIFFVLLFHFLLLAILQKKECSFPYHFDSLSSKGKEFLEKASFSYYFACYFRTKVLSFRCKFFKFLKIKVMNLKIT